MNMCESVGQEDFDVEAQESLLAEEERLISSSSSDDAKQKLLTCILFIHSTLLFTRAHHHHASSSSSSSSSATYTSIHIPQDDDDDGDKGSGPAAAYADSPQDTSSAHPPPSAQQLQRENVSEIVKEKNLELLREFGGVRGVAEALNTDLENGIPIPQHLTLNTDLENGIPIPQQTSPRNPTLLYKFLLITFFRSLLQACNSLNVFFLICAAVLALSFGIHEDGLRMEGLLNGGILLATVLLIVACKTIRTCREKWRSNKTQSAGRMLKVQVVRGGCPDTVDEVDLVEGDIVIVKEGDQLPADGLFVGGDHDHEALRLDDGSTIDEHCNPFMFYGYKVMSGKGRMLVTSTGVDTVWGEMMIRAAIKECDFESYCNRLFSFVNHSSSFISILILVAMFLRFLAGNRDGERRYRPESKGEPTELRTFVDSFKAIITGFKGNARVLTILLSVSLLGITEGAPFLISFSIMNWSHKTLACKAKERDYFACVNMARLTTICTDISGALIEKEMGLIHRLYVGEGFVSEVSNLSPQLVEALCDVIVAPSLLSATTTEIGDPDLDRLEVDSLLSWAESVLGMDRNLIRQSKEIVHYTPNLLLTVEKNGNRGILHCKGPPDQILSMCTHHYDIDGQILELDEEKKREIGRMVGEDAQVTAYACKHIQDLTQVSHHQQPNDFTFLATMSMRKTKMDTIKVSVSRLKEEGVRVILASGEDVSVLIPIARECGLLTTHDLNSDGLVLTGEEFRRLGDAERKNKVDKICIIGNCSPEDKFLLVKCLKETGQVVALVAHRTVDAPALKLADIGLTCEGNYGSEIVRDCSDIILLDANLCCFGFLLNTIKSGRCLLENIRNFIQMQLTFAVSSSLINFTAAVALGDAPITAVQLFWSSLVVPLLGGLALLTGSGSGAAPPIESWEKLITWEIRRNICVQVCYQASVLVSVQHWGEDILETSGDRVKLVIFNAFFLCQMFNIFTAAQPRNMNIFSGLFHKSRYFWAALLLFIICQAVSAAAEELIGDGPGLSMKLWGQCLLFAFLSWPLDLAAKMLFSVALNHPLASQIV